MDKSSSILSRLKFAIPAGILIALSWQCFQITFYKQGLAQPGMTSIPLFFVLMITVFLGLLLSFRWYKANSTHDISFYNLMVQGLLTGVIIAIFGTAFYEIYIEFINPEYAEWLNEIYLESWNARGMSEAEIQNQLATNEKLKTTFGLIYGFFFVVILTLISSILPAILTMGKPNSTTLELA